ncbi:MAG: GNAT family N-acetyltransferase [Flavobacteriales bacterium]|jgi:GNAT superfamily N-acetyltransferase|nr:GNAT family N-acetyltransferase [Flavobacteriales bacterium]
MNDITVTAITDPADVRLERILPMFEDLHAVMHRHGMMQQLPPDGARLWMKGVKAGLERFNRMVIAMHGEEVIGFTCGSLKLAPEYLGGARVGHWTHLYVNAAHRRGGVSRAMSDMMHAWFREQGVSSVETQVVRDHPSSIPFVQSYGYAVEWLHFRVTL